MRKRKGEARVPLAEICDVCKSERGVEHHFITVPLPKGFTRVCDGDLAEIKKEIRRRAEPIVKEVFEEARTRAAQETP